MSFLAPVAPLRMLKTGQELPSAWESAMASSKPSVIATRLPLPARWLPKRTASLWSPIQGKPLLLSR